MEEGGGKRDPLRSKFGVGGRGILSRDFCGGGSHTLDPCPPVTVSAVTRPGPAGEKHK